MPCYYPIDGYRAKSKNDNGRTPIVFRRSEAQQDMAVKLPCGRCIGCRLDRSRDWAIRCTHEAQMWEHNSFLTLTYNDDYLPKTGSLEKDALTLFIRRTRDHFMRSDFRYFGCGEYGDNFGRPHYHTLLLGLDFDDKTYWKHNESGEEKLYISPTLQKLWPFGHSYIGSVTFKSAAYVARYCTKKISGENAAEHYKKVNTQTGEIHDIEPEFMRCSLRPAIGKKWFDTFKSDLDKGFITFEGRKIKTPRYYEKLYAQADEYRSVMQKAERSQAIDDLHPDFTLDRLRDKEACKLYAIKSLKRVEK